MVMGAGAGALASRHPRADLFIIVEGEDEVMSVSARTTWPDLTERPMRHGGSRIAWVCGAGRGGRVTLESLKLAHLHV
jgi:hypothetical protein